MPDLLAVASLERIEEVAVPDIQSDLHQELQDDANDQQRDQRPCDPARQPRPEAESAPPESTQRLSADRRHFVIFNHGGSREPAGRETSDRLAR